MCSLVYCFDTGQADYIVALRARLDQGNLHHVRIIAPDQGGGGMEQIAREMAANKSINDAVWGLGSHYPGAHGTSVSNKTNFCF